jgi:agmatine deiminase
VAALIGELSHTPLTQHAWVLEGGAVDGNGAGTFLTTRECLLHENRNPGMSQEQVEAQLAIALGARKVIWLERGLRGDHTDGHVDNLARFVGRHRVVHMQASHTDDPNADILKEVADALADARSADGERLEVVALPSPGALHGPAGLMAASYCNFLIANQCVVVPTFDRPSDSVALGIFADLFPKRRIVGLDACALLTGGGTVHCISQQEPSPPQAGIEPGRSHV